MKKSILTGLTFSLLFIINQVVAAPCVNGNITADCSPLSGATSIGTMSAGTVDLMEGGSIVNKPGGTITNAVGGFISTHSGGTITNITGAPFDFSIINMTGGTIVNADGGDITNMSGGAITNGMTAMLIDTLSGAASIDSMSGTSSINTMNGGSISAMTGGTITNAVGGFISTHSGGTITNITGAPFDFSIINMTGGTIVNADGGDITNMSGGAITNGMTAMLIDTLSGAASIDSMSGTSSINTMNGGTISVMTGGTISNAIGGLINNMSGGTITNITAAPDNFVIFSMTGGTIMNANGGNIFTMSGGSIDLISGNLIIDNLTHAGTIFNFAVTDLANHGTLAINNSNGGAHQVGMTYTGNPITDFGNNITLDLITVAGIAPTFSLTDNQYTLGAFDYNAIGQMNGNLYQVKLNLMGLNESVRVEAVSSALGGMVSAGKQIQTMSNTLTKRMGDIRLAKQCYGGEEQSVNGVWARGVGRIFDISGFNDMNMDSDIYGFEGGYDYMIPMLNDNRLYIGAAAGISWNNTDFGKKSNMDINAPSVGLYATYLHNDGIFVDVTARYFMMDMDTEIHPMAAASYAFSENNINGVSASMEIGKFIPIKTFDNGQYYIEPRLQYNFTKVGGYANNTNGVQTTSDDYTSHLLTAGMNIGSRTHGIYCNDTLYEPYLKLNLRYELDGQAAASIDNIAYHKNYDGIGLEIGGGLNVQASKNMALYTDISYEIGQGFTSFGGIAGLRYSF